MVLYNNLFIKIFEEEVPIIHSLLKRIEDNKGVGRLVGGCVRDAILNCKASDIDIATNLYPDLIINIFHNSDFKVIPTGIKHGTLTLIYNKTTLPVYKYEVTTLRRDVQCFGRKANIDFTADWQEDALRRDFTFNAMYMDMNGNIYDYFEGINDLRNGNLRFVGDPEERINEDYLRILRAFRFYVRFGRGDISDRTLSICGKFVSKINFLSGERIKSELFNILSLEQAYFGILKMYDTNVLQYILDYHGSITDLDVISPLIMTLTKDVSKKSCPLLKIALILHYNQNISRQNIVNKLKLSKLERKAIEMYANLTIKDLAFNEIEERFLICDLQRESYIDILIFTFICCSYNYLKLSNISNFHDQSLGQFNDKMCDFIKEMRNRLLLLIDNVNNFVIPEFPINGYDLMAFIPSKDLGRVISLVKREWIESNFLIDKDDLIKRAIIIYNTIL